MDKSTIRERISYVLGVLDGLFSTLPADRVFGDSVREICYDYLRSLAPEQDDEADKPTVTGCDT